MTGKKAHLLTQGQHHSYSFSATAATVPPNTAQEKQPYDA